MPENKTFDEAIHTLHRTLEEAEHQLSELGGGLQFLVGLDGDVEIVRRTRSGKTERPKIVIAKLKGCDPVLWRGDVPSWLRSLAPDHDTARTASRDTLPAESSGKSPEEAPGGKPASSSPTSTSPTSISPTSTSPRPTSEDI